MPLRPMSSREVRQKLEALGFIRIAQRGSHIKFARSTESGRRTVIVPDHKKIAIGTIRSIIRQAGITISEFENS
ncbi:MAG: type II toxin-antitoxin system HicA family toxin [Candidatus Melainabacteria bacterium]|nr:MAG: type II toxin-antitoxin system HicA family toxin [Candidatus Melainabacteria bacterium]